MASSQSFSIRYRRISDWPEPASPVNREEPFWMMAMRPSGFSLDRPLSRNSICPSLLLGRPGPKRPAEPFLCSASTAVASRFQSIPKGGLEIQ